MACVYSYHQCPAIPVMKYFEYHPHMPALCLPHDFWFLHQSLLSRYISSLLALLCSLSSWDPCHLVYHYVLTSCCIRGVLVSAVSAIPLPEVLSMVPSLTAVTGSLAVCSFGPLLYTLLLVSLSFTFSSVSLLVLSMLRHITHHIYFLYLSGSWTTARDHRKSGSRAGQLSTNSHPLTSSRPLLPCNTPCT